MNKLEKYLNKQDLDISSDLSEEDRRRYSDQIIDGYEMDERSRSTWLNINREADKIIKFFDERSSSSDTKDFPFSDACKFVYPLLMPAIISLAASLTSNLVKNGKVVYMSKFGKPVQGIDQRADNVTTYMSWELLIEDQNWLLNKHKLMTIVASWGMGFVKVYRDQVEGVNRVQIVHPEDVVINHRADSLDQAPRITIRNFFTKNDIQERIVDGRFNSDIEIDKLNADNNTRKENELDEDQPIYEVLEQYCLLDLDEDGYYEPYVAMVHEDSRTILGLYTAYDSESISWIEDKGSRKVRRIKRTPYIVDFHCVDDPDGGFYSLGLNYLLLNHNTAISSLARQQIDSGTLMNQTNGFVTQYLRPDSRDMEFEVCPDVNELKVVKTPPGIDIDSQIKILDHKGPSPVSLELLNLMVTSAKELGFLNDVLSGDMALQNVPATSMLAFIEQSTRARRPVIEKLYYSLKKEFKLLYGLNYKYLSDQRYQVLLNDPSAQVRVDFNPYDMDIVPVADPAVSSDAQKYAKTRVLMDALQIKSPVLNEAEVLKEVFTNLSFESPERFIVPPPQGPMQDPKMEIDKAKLQLMNRNLDQNEKKIEIENQKVQQKSKDTDIKQMESSARVQKMVADAMKDRTSAQLQDDKLRLDERRVEDAERRTAILARQAAIKANSE